MKNIKLNNIVLIGVIGTMAWSCKAPAVSQEIENHKSPKLPDNFENVQESDPSLNSGLIPWKQFFTDPNLVILIDEALKNNQDLMITLQQIEISKADVAYRKGRLNPTVSAGIGIKNDKSARYTAEGAGNASTEIIKGKKVPDPIMDYKAGISADWEIDIWKKLRNEREAAVSRYLSTVEGKNFVLSSLIAEVASNYYELLSLDSQLEFIHQNIELQKNALEVVKIQKQAARETELAVKKFEAELLKSQSEEFDIRQDITEKENQINALLGRYPQQIQRDKSNFMDLVPKSVYAGVPSQLLSNRPDIKQAELELKATELDVKAARAEFYPSLAISADLGIRAFNPAYLTRMPESIFYSIGASLVGPLINKSAITASFNKANAEQVKALYEYDKTILSAYIDVANQMSKISNLEKSFDYKQKQVEALNQSISVANLLFKNNRADYLEVLMTQRDMLEAKMELITTKEEQLNTVVSIYKSLGGGWK
jgi:outer membrane protein, multidrug efflux system